MTQGRFTPVSLLEYITSGASSGFTNHFIEPPVGLHYTPNYGSARTDHLAVSTALRKRLASGQTLGPFSWDHKLPASIPAMCVDPLGAVPYKLEPDRRRPIQDAAVNQYLYAPYFPMPAFALVRSWATPNCWFGLQDVEGAFPCLGLHYSMWPFFCFAWYNLGAPPPGGALGSDPPDFQEFLYINVAGLFGPRDIPYVFTMYMLLVTLLMVSMGIALVAPYLDDVCHVHEHRGEVSFAMDNTSVLWAHLGSPEKYSKREGPFQRGGLLGREINSRTFTVAVPSDKMVRFRGDLKQVLAPNGVRFRKLESILGLAAFIASVLDPVFGVFINPLQDFTRAQSPSANPWRHIRLSAETRATTRRLLAILPHINRRVSINPALSFTRASAIYSDASGGRHAGWGYASKSHFQGGVFTSYLSRKPICLLELLAVLYAVRSHAKLWTGQVVPFYIDNTVAIGWLTRTRSASGSPSLRREADAALLEIFSLALQYGFIIEPIWIASKDNEMADALSRAEFARFVRAYTTHNWGSSTSS
jgi:hypothetical protein